MSDYEDRQLICEDCQQPFMFEAGEQEFFASKKFTDPKRCKGCRSQRKAKKEAQQGQQGNDYSQTWEDDQQDRGRRRRR